MGICCNVNTSEMRLLICVIGIVLITAAPAPHPAQQPSIPHLAQAWVAQSTGDGLPGATGKESYLYEGCKKPTDDCMNAHIFDYGASNCIKIEIDAGYKSQFSGTWLLKCDAVNCCYEGDENRDPADVKKWDIFHPTGHLDPFRRQVAYLGNQQTTELNGKVVPNADAWNEVDHLPFTKQSVNYTYFVTKNAGNDTITHRIDFTAPGADGSILYGDFQVQHNLTAFRKAIQQYVPAECLKPNTLQCASEHAKKWNSKLPHSFGY